ncbi:purine-nucleoside phosphorylase [Roseiconus nitratireducens]|uniref:Purine nucleoside phosphorylase n=1 Tax=Roseiconus nitratireducens TaxID=2605748 RepID=A0A5M6D302_9BACT|nr:purine-nucleoside phosphorylase [Roseiconus nitratireducens]KAA5540069.1 purine-nucleoside phosphorylase [Roseiconus nitratireducens]
MTCQSTPPGSPSPDVRQAVDDICRRIGRPSPAHPNAADSDLARPHVDPAELPTTGIVLGSGLGALADRIAPVRSIPFGEIHGFARSTAAGHRGQLIVGDLMGTRVIAMAGRLHRYEGWTEAQVRFPVRVMAALGVRTLITSNAAGGVNPRLRVGDIVVIRDHINWLHCRRQPEQAENPPRSGTEIPGRDGDVYDRPLARTALAAARREGFCAQEGTYLATLGPNYETRAEYRMMRRLGADVVGMSTVSEVLAAAQCRLAVLALSIVSNVADPDRPIVADHADVLQAGDAAAVKMECIVREILTRPPESEVPSDPD